MATFSMSFSIHVNVPPEVVFAYVADLTRHGEWNPGLKVTAISAVLAPVGNRFQSVGHVMGWKGWQQSVLEQGKSRVD